MNYSIKVKLEQIIVQPEKKAFNCIMADTRTNNKYLIKQRLDKPYSIYKANNFMKNLGTNEPITYNNDMVKYYHLARHIETLTKNRLYTLILDKPPKETLKISDIKLVFKHDTLIRV